MQPILYVGWYLKTNAKCNSYLSVGTVSQRWIATPLVGSVGIFLMVGRTEIRLRLEKDWCAAMHIIYPRSCYWWRKYVQLTGQLCYCCTLFNREILLQSLQYNFRQDGKRGKMNGMELEERVDWKIVLFLISFWFEKSSKTHRSII